MIEVECGLFLFRIFGDRGFQVLPSIFVVTLWNLISAAFKVIESSGLVKQYIDLFAACKGRIFQIGSQRELVMLRMNCFGSRCACAWKAIQVKTASNRPLTGQVEIVAWIPQK